MDRLGADFFNSVQTIVDRLGANAVPIQLPLGKELEFQGVIDLVAMKALVYENEDLGSTYATKDIPADLMEQAQEYREKMLEAVVEFDEVVLERYLNGETLKSEEIKTGDSCWNQSIKNYSNFLRDGI